MFDSSLLTERLELRGLGTVPKVPVSSTVYSYVRFRFLTKESLPSPTRDAVPAVLSVAEDREGFVTSVGVMKELLSDILY